MPQQRPTTSPALAFASQRVWHGGHQASKSKLPPTITKDQHAVPPEYRRKRAVDAFFEQQQKSQEARSKRELKATGGSGGGGRWNENPMQRFRLKNGIFDPEDGKSCYYMRASKEVHAVQLPSYKTDCPRNCDHNQLSINPNDPTSYTDGSNKVGETNSFFVEPLTRLSRERWMTKENIRSRNISLHESSYPLRRLKDRSAQTLDNQYRQEMDPLKPSQTVMKSVLGGTFYDAPPTNTGTNHRFRASSSSAAAAKNNSNRGHGNIIGDPRLAASGQSTGSTSRGGGALTPNFVSANKRNVRCASAVVGMCRSKGAI